MRLSFYIYGRIIGMQCLRHVRAVQLESALTEQVSMTPVEGSQEHNGGADLSRNQDGPLFTSSLFADGRSALLCVHQPCGGKLHHV